MCSEELSAFDDLPRSFGDDPTDVRQMLPIKLAGGKIVSVSKKMDDDDEKDDEEGSVTVTAF